MLENGKYKKRLQRLNTPGVAHYLTFSTYKKLPFLKNDLPCQWLQESIGRARKRFAFDLWAFVFMPEHVHLLIFPREESCNIGKILASIKLPVSRKAMNYWEKHNPQIITGISVKKGNRVVRRFWEAGGGYDSDIFALKTYGETIEYIHNNPVVKGLCESPLDWKWSSAGWYAGKPDQPLDIDQTIPVL